MQHLAKGRRFFTSRVAKRIFWLFVVCALLPIGAFGLVTFGHVTGQLKEQNHRRIQKECKSIGMGILERLGFLESEIELLVHEVKINPDVRYDDLSEPFKKRLAKRFDSLGILGPQEGEYLYGHRVNPPRLDETGRVALESGKTVLRCGKGGEAASHVFVMRLLDKEHPDEGIVVGKAHMNYLWGIGDMNILPAMSELSVFDETQEVLLSSIPLPDDFGTHLASRVNDSSERRFEWSYDGREYLASSWVIFLKSKYSSPNWTAVLSQEKEEVLAATASFKKTYPLVLLMSLWVVILLSAIQIRRYLVPLQKLKAGVQSIGEGNFETSVGISSRDEFQDLANSFNKMAKQLGKQFYALTTMGEIGRTVLASLKKEKIVETLLSRINDVCSCDHFSIGIEGEHGKNDFLFFSRSREGSEKSIAVARTLSEDDLTALYHHRDYLYIGASEHFPDYVKSPLERIAKAVTVFPVFLKKGLAGVIVLYYCDNLREEGRDSDEARARAYDDLNWARQLADQVAVALSNAQLLEVLDGLSWGALTALARTVDAKSHWTAGHSERVTELAIEIGKEMNLSGEQSKILHKGALLHDIGKVGVPASILDKTGKLTGEEFATIKRHPEIGARILEPIESFSDILSIVLQHHERYDGTGYPNGLKGESIALGARVVAVADVFEAVTADRPYRPGWELERAVALIRDGSGKHFDPRVVAAFLKVVERAEFEEKTEGAAVESRANAVVGTKGEAEKTLPVIGPERRLGQGMNSRLISY